MTLALGAPNAPVAKAAAIELKVKVAVDRHPISDDIYGINFACPVDADGLRACELGPGLSLRRRAIEKKTNVNVGPSGFTMNYPARSITLVEIAGA